MESLALVVSAILGGMALVSITILALSFLVRSGKIKPVVGYVGLGVQVLLAVWSYSLAIGLGNVALLLALANTAILFLPKGKKP